MGSLLPILTFFGRMRHWRISSGCGRGERCQGLEILCRWVPGGISGSRAVSVTIVCFLANVVHTNLKLPVPESSSYKVIGFGGHQKKYKILSSASNKCRFGLNQSRCFTSEKFCSAVPQGGGILQEMGSTGCWPNYFLSLVSIFKDTMDKKLEAVFKASFFLVAVTLQSVVGVCQVFKSWQSVCSIPESDLENPAWKIFQEPWVSLVRWLERFHIAAF